MAKCSPAIRGARHPISGLRLLTTSRGTVCRKASRTRSGECSPAGRYRSRACQRSPAEAIRSRYSRSAHTELVVSALRGRLVRNTTTARLGNELTEAGDSPAVIPAPLRLASQVSSHQGMPLPRTANPAHAATARISLVANVRKYQVGRPRPPMPTPVRRTGKSTVPSYGDASRLSTPSRARSHRGRIRISSLPGAISSTATGNVALKRQGMVMPPTQRRAGSVFAPTVQTTRPHGSACHVLIQAGGHTARNADHGLQGPPIECRTQRVLLSDSGAARQPGGGDRLQRGIPGPEPAASEVDATCARTLKNMTVQQLVCAS